MKDGSYGAFLLMLLELTEGDILRVLGQYGVPVQDVTLRREKPKESNIVLERPAEFFVIDVATIVEEEKKAARRGWYNPKTIGHPRGRQGGCRGSNRR